MVKISSLPAPPFPSCASLLPYNFALESYCRIFARTRSKKTTLNFFILFILLSFFLLSHLLLFLLLFFIIVVFSVFMDQDQLSSVSAAMM